MPIEGIHPPSFKGRPVIDLDCAPFEWGGWLLLSDKGRDSIVVSVPYSEDQRAVVKWNKVDFSKEQAYPAAQYMHRCIELYKASLGEEHILPTLLNVGEKSDGGITRYKVYTAQLFEDSWTARDLPEELRKNEELTRKWLLLYSRISNLYTVAREVNHETSANGGAIFPIALRIGQLWNYVQKGLTDPPMPKSPNILITKNDRDIKLCDFGTYTLWSPDMEPAYQEILQRTVLG